MDDTSLRAAGADEGGENQGQSAQVPAASGQDTVVTVIHDDEETGERGKDQAQHKRIMPMKRPNLDVRAEFDLETKGEGKTEVKCKHCKVIVQTAKTVNTSRLRQHSSAKTVNTSRLRQHSSSIRQHVRSPALARCATCKTKSRPVSLIASPSETEKEGRN